MKKKILPVMMAAVLSACALAACGGSTDTASSDSSGETTAASSAESTAEDTSGGETAAEAAEEESGIAGSYLAVAGEAMGFTLTGDEVAGFNIELDADGSGTMTVDEDSQTFTWTQEGETLIITIEGENIEAVIGEDILTFEDMLGMGMDLTFAKEGTEAADPELYLPEEEKAMIGVWTSHAVATVMGDDASEEVDPASIRIEFFSNHTAVASFGDTDLGETGWELFSSSGYFDDEYVLTGWDQAEDAIEIIYSTEDDYWVFTCTKE